MKMKLKYSVLSGVAALAVTLGSVSCKDTWDDHYTVDGAVPGATLWECIEADESLRYFAEVLDACGYKDKLNAQQVYTVWAPAITEQEARDLIASYKSEKGKDEDKTTVREFIANHIALYNYPVSSLTDGQSVKMVNGKRMVLSNGRINDEVDFDATARVPASNGVLYKINGKLAFFPNVWESIARDSVGDEGLDSLYAFFRSWEEVELDEGASVPGGIVNGQTVYLDSVTYTYNREFNLYGGHIDREDSLYWFLAPTNKLWREQLENYRNYFVYHDSVALRDSLQDVYAKRMIYCNSFFNVRSQRSPFNEENPDSICSTIYSSYNPGYAMFEWPMQSGGLLNGLSYAECSNGRLYKDNEGRIDPTKCGYMRRIKVEAEYTSNYSLGRLESSASSPLIATAVDAETEVDSLQVSSGGYLRVIDSESRARNNQPEVTFLIPNVLSNCPYDIKVVFASPLAADSLATADAALKRRISARIRYYRTTTATSPIQGGLAPTLCSNVDVDATRTDTITVAEGYSFPVGSYGEDRTRVWLTILSLKGNSIPEGYAQPLLIDCVILEPRPDLATSSVN